MQDVQDPPLPISEMASALLAALRGQGDIAEIPGLLDSGDLVSCDFDEHHCTLVSNSALAGATCELVVTGRAVVKQTVDGRVLLSVPGERGITIGQRRGGGLQARGKVTPPRRRGA